jgi:predicted aldo/keto reductase-like oxidoreductase
MKGELFRMGNEVGLTDRNRLAEIGIKWNLSHEAVTNLIVGTNNADHLVNNLKVLNNLELTGEDNSIIEKIRTSNSYKAYEERKANEFFELK